MVGPRTTRASVAGGRGGGPAIIGGGYNRPIGGYEEVDIYGRRPDPVKLADPAAALGSRFPGLDRTNSALSSEILNMIQGRDPQLPMLAANTGATRAAQLGLTGSGFQDRLADLSLYDRRNALRNQGIAAYNATIPTIAGTQTNSPALQQANDTQNNIWASSPDPAAAIERALQLYQGGLGALTGFAPMGTRQAQTGQPGMDDNELYSRAFS